MTNDRIVSESAIQWKYCPWCGKPLTIDQDLSLLKWDDNGFNAEASAEAGLNFEESIMHCGFDIRIWAPRFKENELK